MLDTISMQKCIVPPQSFIGRIKEPIEYNNILFNPLYSACGHVNRYLANIDNLKLTLSEFGANHYLTITNSLHKFWVGNNYSDYYYYDIKDTIEYLTDCLGVSLLDAELGKLSYGVNIEAEANKVYPYWASFKNKEFWVMQMKGKKYGAYTQLTDFKVKGYDKTLEVWRNDREKIDSQLFRFEVEVSKMRHLNKRSKPLNIRTVKDLLDTSKLQLLGDDLLTKFDAIDKECQYDFTKLKRPEAMAYAIMTSDEAIRGHLKENYSKTFERHKTNFKKAKKKIITDDSQENIRYLISEKWQQLLSA